MRAIWIIARLTLKEALLNRILYLLLFFALFIISFSLIIGKLTVGDEMKIIKDMGLSGIHFFGVMITILIGINLIFREMEKRTVYLILTKPIKRYQFLLGKYCGLALTLLLTMSVLAAAFYAVLLSKKDPDPHLLPAFGVIYLEWLLLAAIAVLFSSFSTPLLSTMLSFAAFFTGHLTEGLLLLADHITSQGAKIFLSLLYYALPNLELFNIRAQVVHGLPLPPLLFAEIGLYWLLYVLAILLLSVRIFEGKDFV